MVRMRIRSATYNVLYMLYTLIDGITYLLNNFKYKIDNYSLRHPGIWTVRIIIYYDHE